MGMFTLLQQVLSQILFFSATSILCYLVGSVIYNLYFSPLAKYPGPFWAKVSSLPSFYYTFTGYRHIWIWQCHQIYGDTFRYRPDGVIINNPSGYRGIYGNKANVKKGKLYEVAPRNPYHFSTLNTVDRAAHDRKRRILNAAFSDKAIKSAEDFIIKHVDRWCQLLVEDVDSTGWTPAKNMKDITNYLTFDIMGDLAWGKSFELKEPNEDNPLREIPHIISGYLKFFYPLIQSPFLNVWVWLKFRGLNSILERISPPEVKQFHKFVNDTLVERTELEKLRKQGSEENMRKDTFHYLYHAEDPDTGKPAYTMESLYAEAELLILAGADSTGLAIRSFLFYITRNPRAYTRITKEIRTTFGLVDEIKSGQNLSSCYYMRACIDEAMRLTPPGPSESPREVLEGGMEIDGQFFPAGTILGSGEWALFRNEECFGDPGTFRPERWIVDEAGGVSAESVALAQSAFVPFSIGTGSCAGQKLAILELQLTIARLLFLVDLKTPKGNSLGGGAPELGWGRRDRNQYQVADTYMSQTNGPLVQFSKRHI
ncbi:cytochrome P450 monooxygenase-like protein [Mollisia scopiformis]|uniref:Cytochrome P450 monooxygenase-like protein n=1 Tax=Mollisia scopiformis TaxID=149040 RepID=A0A194XHE1_MOLSC|nr:cytochrome P450 monooxygenase-like protein [Mollisia scopiformis]KUJ19544.1 cytochrome P450 monooxygenase-like protein [Mollisia scopiformis]